MAQSPVAAGLVTGTQRFSRLAAADDDKINLAEGALVIASDEYPDLDVDAYLSYLDEMAGNLKRRLRPDISAADTILALNRFLFDELGFSGSGTDYYDPRNSFFNDVLDRKRGIPITLSLLYIEIGRRLGLSVYGVCFPAHFLVKCQMRDAVVVLDPYAKGISLGLDELRRRLKHLRDDGSKVPELTVGSMLAAANNRQILVRVLSNLKSIYLRNSEWMKALTATGRIIELMPDLAGEYRDRGVIYSNLECFRAALADMQAYLKMAPDAADAPAIRCKANQLQAQASLLN